MPHAPIDNWGFLGCHPWRTRPNLKSGGYAKQTRDEEHLHGANREQDDRRVGSLRARCARYSSRRHWTLIPFDATGAGPERLLDSFALHFDPTRKVAP
jgi:hypothetical protein